MATIGGVTITNKQPTAQSSWQKQAEFTVAAWRKRAEQEKKEKERQARLREQQRQWRYWSERYRQSMAAVNPTADPNASSTEYKKRAAEAMSSTAKRATAMGLPSVLADRAFGEVAQETPYWRSREAVKKVGALTPEEIEAQENDPMFEYQRLSRSWGADVVGERMATIKDMWDVYGIPYSGDALVWELTKSQFTMPEIKNMLEESHYLMYEDPDRLNLRDMAVDELWVHMRDTYNMKPEQFESFKELFEAQRKNELPSQWESGDKLGAILTMSLFIPVPGFQWASALRGTITTSKVGQAINAARTTTVATVELGAKALLGAARFGGKFQAVMSGFGGLMELNEEQRLSAIADKQVRAEKALELAGSPISQVLPVLQTEQELPNPFQELKDLRAALGAFNTPENRDDIIQICEEMQEFGVGTDLEVTGVLDWDWQEAITDAYKDGIRAVYDEQRLAIEEGDADYDAEINGDMDDPYWQEVFARREERQLLSDQAKTENYDRWMWFERSGIPRNSLEAAALGRRIASNGWLQAAYGSLLHTALTIGQVVDATASAINLNVRQWKDPAYQAAVNDLIAYVDAQVITGTTGGYAGQPEHADEAFARAQIMDPTGPLGNDPEAKRLLAAVDQRQAELIDEDYDADFLETAGLLFGSSPERMKQIEQEHPDIVRAFTTGVYIATAKVNPVGRVYRAAFKPTVDSNMAAFLGSNRAKMMVDRVSSYLSQLDAGRAISYIKGTSAAPIINRLWRLQGKKVDHVSPKSQILRDLANEVVDAVDRGTPERVATILRGADDAVVDGVVATARGAAETFSPVSETYAYAPMETAQVAGATWYHGTKLDAAPNTIYARKAADNLVGPGLYLTDRPGVASGYAGKGKVFATKADVPARAVVDLDAVATAPVKRVVSDWLRQNGDQFDFTKAAEQLTTRPLLYVYQSIRRALADEGITRLHADEIITSLNDRFLAAGFQAFKHTGGQFVGKVPHNVLVLLDPFGESGRAPLNLRFVESLPPQPSRVGPATRSEIAGWVGSVAEREIAVGRVATWLAKRQNKHHDAVSKELLSERLNEQLAVEYAKGADIFPYLRENHVLPPNRVLAIMNKRISRVKNDWLRSFLSKWTVGLITRAPTTEIELRDLNTLDRVYDAALTISQDAGWAWTFRNKWAASTNNVRLLKLVDELEAKFDQKFYSRIKQEDLPWTRRVGQALGKEYEQGGQALAPLPDAVLRGLVTEKTAAQSPMLTKYNLSTPGKRGQTTAQAVPDTTYQQYLVSLHRSSLWAPYRLPMHGKSLEAFARNSPVILKNIYRSGFLGPAHKVSVPLRQWTVAMGAPLLFQKHALTDSFRTYMETGGSSLIESFGLRGVSINGLKIVPKILSFHARKMEDVLSTLSPSLRDTILYSKARVHASEAQWLSGTSKQVFRPKTIRDANGKIIDLDGSANALRRILEGKAFQQYSQGGYGAVQLWLDTREGKAFLREGGWYTRHKEMWKEQHAGEALPTIKQSGLHEIVKQEYLDTIVQKEFMRLETALPNIMPVMKEMALNEKLWDVNRLKKLIEENPTDNAVLSMPAHIWAGNSMAGYIVGKAMFANKWNRDVVFDHIFIRQYNKLTKEGIEADNAARVAATIAEINTSRIHFDLSNALAVEARHRWLAWFATKHRLFGTYIMKLAIERPTIAAAAVEIKNWMEERNEKLGVGEFDRYDLVIPRADGSQWRINLAPYMWFAEFPLESSLATAMEHAAAFVADKTVGWELHPSPTPFGLTFTRADALITNFWYVMTADNAVKQPADLLESGEAKDLQEAHEMANESLTNWLNSLSPSQALRWRKLINNQRALALARGEQWTALMAFNEVRRSVLIDEAFKCFKAYSGRNMSAEEVEIERLLKEFSDLSATDQEAARELLAKEPELAAVLNAQMDPVEKEQYDEGWRLFNIFRAAFQRDLENADKNGTLINDYDRLADEFANSIDRLVNPTYQAGENSIYNEVFARSFGDYNPEEFIKSIGLFMPTIPPGSVWEMGRAKTQEEKDAKTAELEVAFNEAIAQLHLMPAETVGKKHAGGDSSQLLYKMIYDELVTIPLSEYAGESDYSLLPHRAANAAGYLANGGDETLVYRADVFMDTVKERTFRQWMASGLGSYGTATSPMAAYILDDQWDMLGMNRDPGARQAWMEWALADWAVKYWAKTTTYEEAVTAGVRDKWLPDSYLTKTPEELAKDKEDWGVSTSSTIYKSLREFWLGEDSVLLQRLMGNSGFRAEYEFSKLKLHERLIALGVGMGDDEESKGMAEFLGLCSDYWDELGQIENPAAEGGVGVGPTASRARPVWDKYIEKVADLAERNRDWWVMFRGTYSLNQFGFVTTWRKKDRPDIEALYSNADAYIEPGFTDEPEWYE